LVVERKGHLIRYAELRPVRYQTSHCLRLATVVPSTQSQPTSFPPVRCGAAAKQQMRGNWGKKH